MAINPIVSGDQLPGAAFYWEPWEQILPTAQKNLGTLYLQRQKNEMGTGIIITVVDPGEGPGGAP